jgi:uncharacterized protein (DUF1778 family)
MSTTKPRITVTLTEHQHEVLKAVCAASGQSMSAFLGEVVEMSMPTFEKMAQAFGRLRNVQQVEKQRLADALERAHGEVEPLARAVMGEFGRMVDAIEAAAEPPSRSARSTRKAGLDASSKMAGQAPGSPLTNRGVTPKVGKSRKSLSGKANRQVER